jgi:hypothetical protein
MAILKKNRLPKPLQTSADAATAVNGWTIASYIFDGGSWLLLRMFGTETRDSLPH